MSAPLETPQAQGLFSSSFDFEMRTRVVYGPDRVDELGDLAAATQAKRVLLVSDPGIVQAGHAARGIEAIRNLGIECQMFDGACENPTTREVGLGLELAKDFRPDLLVGLGGGSSMDCAKGINFVYTNGGEMKDYWGVGKATEPMLPMIAVPTTAGTGSELQSFALISDAETHAKMACGDKKATCLAAILDPNLTLTQPASVTALTGIDAISHAIETYVTTKRNPISVAYSRQSWQWLASAFPKVLAEPTDIEARSVTQIGASLAGLAIENSMLGAAHALANPLTATYDVPHGQAVGLMLPHVVRANAQTMGKEYSELELILESLETGGLSSGSSSLDDGEMRPGERLATWLQRLLVSAGLVTQLHELGVSASRLPQLAADASRQWTLQFNPCQLSETDLFALYQAAF